jgi:hypothetical protein
MMLSDQESRTLREGEEVHYSEKLGNIVNRSVFPCTLFIHEEIHGLLKRIGAPGNPNGMTLNSN